MGVETSLWLPVQISVSETDAAEQIVFNLKRYFFPFIAFIIAISRLAKIEQRKSILLKVWENNWVLSSSWEVKLQNSN